MSAGNVAPARRAAYEVLRRVFDDDAWADRALRTAAERHGLDPRDRALAQRLSYGAVKRRGTTDHIAADLSRRGVDELDAPVAAALRLGLYELLFHSATPDHAAVDQSVELAKTAGRGRGGEGLVNAVLRRAARERSTLLAGMHEGDPAAAALAHSYPEWLARLWWDQLGPDGARGVMAAGNEPPETALRVNTLRADRDAIIAELGDAGVVAAPGDGPPPLDAGEAVVVTGGVDLAALPAFREGRVTPQSRGSITVAQLLAPVPGERVLDLCAGPGVKTSQIAVRMRDEGVVVAVERDRGRAAEIREMCQRIGVGSAEVLEADAERADLGDGYDRILVDPPCSDLGTLGSRPDARWRKSAEQIERLAPVQRRILGRAIGAMRPGGTLVYSTCTISQRENEEVMLEAVSEATAGGLAIEVDDLSRELPVLASAVDARFLQLRPDRDRTTGFFIARLRRGA